MIIAFPRDYQPYVEIFTVRDRADGRLMFIFELVGRDEEGPYRLDVAHRYTLEEVFEDRVLWWRDGIEVRDAGIFP